MTKGRRSKALKIQTIIKVTGFLHPPDKHKSRAPSLLHLGIVFAYSVALTQPSSLSFVGSSSTNSFFAVLFPGDTRVLFFVALFCFLRLEAATGPTLLSSFCSLSAKLSVLCEYSLSSSRLLPLWCFRRFWVV